MEFAEHGATVAPYVVKALRRYMLGPDAVGPVKLGVAARRDRWLHGMTAPRPLELDADSRGGARGR